MNPSTELDACPLCGGHLKERLSGRSIRVGSRTVSVLVSAPTCDSCGEYYLDDKSLEELQTRVANQIREQEDLLKPQEILAIRERLGLTQGDFEQFLGVGYKTVVRWERGTVFPNAATDNLLRVIANIPEAADFLSARSGVPIVKYHNSYAIPVGESALRVWQVTLPPESWTNLWEVSVTPGTEYTLQPEATPQSPVNLRLGDSAESDAPSLRVEIALAA